MSSHENKLLTGGLSCLSLRKQRGNGGNCRLGLVLRLLRRRSNLRGRLHAAPVQNAFADLPDDEDENHEYYQQAEGRAHAQSGQYSRGFDEVLVQVGDAHFAQG